MERVGTVCWTKRKAVGGSRCQRSPKESQSLQVLICGWWSGDPWRIHLMFRELQVAHAGFPAVTVPGWLNPADR
jgi:hypothetical protein